MFFVRLHCLKVMSYTGQLLMITIEFVTLKQLKFVQPHLHSKLLLQVVPANIALIMYLMYFKLVNYIQILH
jgi:hypothetical protein